MNRNRGFAAAALLTIALGVGVNTAFFSVLYGVLFRPLPYPESDRLVRLSERHTGATSPLRAPVLSNLAYYAWKDSARTIIGIAAYGGGRYAVTGLKEPLRKDVFSNSVNGPSADDTGQWQRNGCCLGSRPVRIRTVNHRLRWAMSMPASVTSPPTACIRLSGCPRSGTARIAVKTG
jgi:hypothetical protein